MPKDQFEALFTKIEKNSRSEAVILTALSKAIDRFEERLTRLPAKTEVGVKFGDVGFVLRFRRGKVDWRLFVDANPENFEAALVPLRDAPVEVRIEALRAFQPILEEIAKAQARLQDIGRDVLKTIRQLGLEPDREGEADVTTAEL